MKRFSKNSIIVAIRAWLYFLLLLILIFAVSYFQMLPVIKRYAESVAETTMLNAANSAVINVLKNENINYNDIAKLSKSDDGSIQSLEIDTYKINLLKSLISNEVSTIVDLKESYSVKIPIGSFLNSPYTTGVGPKISFKMQLTSTAFVDFKHEFRSAGINQVLHLIHIKISIRGSIVAPWYTGAINVQTSSIAAQTVIVGATPDAFTNVIEEVDDNTAGLINDYGAIAGE